MTEGLVGDEHCSYSMGRGCGDQVFVIKEMSEKCIAKGKNLYVIYMDLEKAYDRVDRNVMWRVLSKFPAPIIF